MVCTYCRVDLPVEAFNKRPARPKGYFSRCKVCVRETTRERRAKHYQANKERLLARQLAYAIAHRDAEAARARAWREANPEKVYELNQDYYWNNAERLRAYAVDYARNHPEQTQARNRRRKAVERAATGNVTATEWAAIVEAYNGACVYCGATERLTQDHVVPLAAGGTHSPDNVVPACLSCNCSKGARPVEAFRQRIAARLRGM